MFKNALVSVSDKSGLVDFIKPLAEKGMRVVSTGGTAKILKEAGIPVVLVSEQTGFPEVMDGRVKTLHPKIHMALLARDFVQSDFATLEENEIEAFDLVVGNLYAFEEALKKGVDERELQEFIDIGGPSLLRAAAKNYSRITTVVDPSDYEWLLSKEKLEFSERKTLAAKVFSHVSTYDSMVASALGSSMGQPDLSFGGKFVNKLRYGENPQQEASWYRYPAQSGLHDSEILQGKELSYNNLLDLTAAVETLVDFEKQITCVAVKHNNPCGVGSGESVGDAVAKALGADPVSVFGGIIALNQTVDSESAHKLKDIFLECVVAPNFEKEALEVLNTKKNLRLLKAPQLMSWKYNIRFRDLFGGFLVQSDDRVTNGFSSNWKVYGDEPDSQMKENISFVWKVCAHLKSNAIALANQNQTIGLGMGQVNRVDAVEQALRRAQKHHKITDKTVLASDAFFPFADSVELAAKAGVKWIVQPGGSIKDTEVIDAAKKWGVTLILTSQRHFKH